jgi:phage terminase large subunit-like protein
MQSSVRSEMKLRLKVRGHNRLIVLAGQGYPHNSGERARCIWRNSATIISWGKQKNSEEMHFNANWPTTDLCQYKQLILSGISAVIRKALREKYSITGNGKYILCRTTKLRGEIHD